MNLSSSPRPILLTPPRFEDERGFFSETWNRQQYAELGVDVDFLQDNHSFSRDVNTVRGLHFQAPPHAQGKLVRVISGAILDVAVDIRKGAPSYGKWISELLSAENGSQLYVPLGYLHGFITREPDTEVAYKCTDYYAPETEGAIRFDDVALGIDWGTNPEDAVLSAKDAAAGSFADFDSPFVYDE